MSIVRALSAVGTVLACAVGAAGDAAPPADPSVVRELLVEVGLMPADGATRDDASGCTSGDAEVARALRRFQVRAGLVRDGVAGPRTVHLLARYAAELRDVRQLGLAA
jgi:murein L,D-transpeptidase YcbB/YkuD